MVVELDQRRRLVVTLVGILVHFAQMLNGRAEKSTRSMSTSNIRAPNRSAWARIEAIRVRALDAVDEPGVVLDVTGQHQLTARRGARQPTGSRLALAA